MSGLWLAVALVLVTGIALVALAAAAGGTASRIVAFQAATPVIASLVVALAAGLGETSYLDLALAIVLLGLVGTLLFARMLERWL